MRKPALSLAVLIILAGCAPARERDRYAAPPPPSGYRYYGTVNSYYGPYTVYAPPGQSVYPAYPTYPSYGASYGAGYATAPECDANCYGAGYDWSGGNSNGYGGGYASPASGYNYGYPSNQYQRMNPWAGYNGGWGNGHR